ncbi:testicular haploid expressed gene protein-like [Gigantopelta aegis]|uniref:testicular haploid expressed gene protein-like n=1 Tax=Gigantopelta aegis TaxID=1735272 RepID=UPI001B88CE5F|nr:testicular haploid expressed gene protein-like [Gigantopelta aegis]
MSTMTEERNQGRIDVLAKPKPYAPTFREDRPSVYWTDHKPLEPGPDGHTVINASQRVQELAGTKQLPTKFALPRSTSIWPVKPAAKNATASERIESLGQPKSVNHDYQMDRTPYMTVGGGAKSAQASERVEVLARPKPRVDRYAYPEDSWGQYIPVSLAAMQCKDNPHIDRLAEPKPYHSQYLGARLIQWPVGESAIKAIASLRLQQLARPLSRALTKDDYDPYVLSAASKRAKPSARVEELSQPIPRKVRQKKI